MRTIIILYNGEINVAQCYGIYLEVWNGITIHVQGALPTVAIHHIWVHALNIVWRSRQCIFMRTLFILRRKAMHSTACTLHAHFTCTEAVTGTWANGWANTQMSNLTGTCSARTCFCSHAWMAYKSKKIGLYKLASQSRWGGTNTLHFSPEGVAAKICKIV